jgi:diguanylate cyclase (GGDEF)-like protein/PAS domain S-box-containing protein
MSLAQLLPDGTAELVRVNQAACALTGHTAEELLHRGPWALVPPADIERVAAAIGELATQAGHNVRVEHGLMCADGTLRWVSHSLALIPHQESVGQLVISHFEDMTDRRRTEARLTHMAFHDPLTGLPNRTMLRDRLEQGLLRLRRHAGVVAVLFCDLDRFKVINDNLGHDTGDRLLIAVAARLSSAVRPGDTVARFGGDEFVVLAAQLPDRRAAAELADRLHDALNPPFPLADRTVVLEASIGVALGHSAGQRAEDLVRDADTALYVAKSRGRGLTEFFGQQARNRVSRSYDIETWLRNALSDDSLELHYQPQLSLADGRVSGVEALLRWRGTPQPQLTVAEVIAAAEESGLIVALGNWVVNQACQQLARWDRQDTSAVHAIGTVSVNLSPSQIVRSDLVDVVSDAVHRAAVDPARLCVEITETAILNDLDAATARLDDLRQLAVRTALDDFGTGYSSLSYLTRLPIDIIKIDRSFVAALGTDSPNAAVIDAVVAMARRLGIRTVGEGAESAAQITGLITSGADEAQGYYFSRAVPASQVPHLVPALEQRASTFLYDRTH